MAVSQSLSVTEVVGSPSVETNQSEVRIVWKSTQTGDSWNGNTRTAKYYISINGGKETEYTVSYTLPKATTQTILDKTITVTHNDDGTGKVSVRTWMDTNISAGVIEKSQSITLTSIERASQPSCITWPDNTKNIGDIGKAIKIHMNRKSNSFTHTVKYYFVNTSGTIGTGVTDNVTWNIPLSLATQIPSDTKGSGTISVDTYKGTTLIGTKTCPFTCTIPNNTSTQPSVTMSLSAISSLSSAFSGLYIQGKSKVKATLSANLPYGGSVQSYIVKVDGTNYDSDDNFTSECLTKNGSIKVSGHATDSRGYTGTTEEVITVLGYTKPTINVSVCDRCDANGNLSDSGTYLKIKATRNYNTVTSNGVQKNFCEIRYRYKNSSASSYSQWHTILDRNNLDTDTVEAAPLLNGQIAINKSYFVQIQAIDDIGEYGETTITVQTETVHTHRAKNGVGFGKYCEGENLLDVGWDAHFHGDVLIGEEGLTLRDYILTVINEGGN